MYLFSLSLNPYSRGEVGTVLSLRLNAILQDFFSLLMTNYFIPIFLFWRFFSDCQIHTVGGWFYSLFGWLDESSFYLAAHLCFLIYPLCSIVLLPNS